MWFVLFLFSLCVFFIYVAFWYYQIQRLFIHIILGSEFWPKEYFTIIMECVTICENFEGYYNRKEFSWMSEKLKISIVSQSPNALVAISVMYKKNKKNKFYRRLAHKILRLRL